MSDRGMLARWDHAKWLQDRLGEARAENAALTSERERLRAALRELDRELPPVLRTAHEMIAAALGEADDDDLELSA